MPSLPAGNSRRPQRTRSNPAGRRHLRQPRPQSVRPRRRSQSARLRHRGRRQPHRPRRPHRLRCARPRPPHRRQPHRPRYRRRRQRVRPRRRPPQCRRPQRPHPPNPHPSPLPLSTRSGSARSSIAIAHRLSPSNSRPGDSRRRSALSQARSSGWCPNPCPGTSPRISAPPWPAAASAASSSCWPAARPSCSSAPSSPRKTRKPSRSASQPKDTMCGSFGEGLPTCSSSARILNLRSRRLPVSSSPAPQLRP